MCNEKKSILNPSKSKLVEVEICEFLLESEKEKFVVSYGYVVMNERQ